MQSDEIEWDEAYDAAIKRGAAGHELVAMLCREWREQDARAAVEMAWLKQRPATVGVAHAP